MLPERLAWRKPCSVKPRPSMTRSAWAMNADSTGSVLMSSKVRSAEVGSATASGLLAGLPVERFDDPLAGDGLLHESDLGAGSHLDRDLLVGHPADPSKHPADRDDLIPHLEALHEVPLVPGPALLRPDEEEVEDGHHQHERDQECEVAARLGLSQKGCDHPASPMKNGGSAAGLASNIYRLGREGARPGPC